MDMTTPTTPAAETLTVRAAAFTGRGVETVTVKVDGDTVRVYDDVAGHFTVCHSLTPSAIKRIRKLAAAR